MTVRRACDPYWYANLAWGSLAGFAALTALLFLPQRFPLFVFPLDAAAAAGIVGWISSRTLPMRRLLTAQRDREARVRTTARAAFVDMGISRTMGRTGILVFVSVLERRVEVVADIGVPVQAVGAAWNDALHGLQHAVEGNGDSKAFFAALRTLGPALASVLPRAADDVNELPDAMEVA